MGYLSGDIEELACNHPVLGNYRFQAKANESWTIDRGGLRGNDDANSVTGSGQNIRQQNMTRWSAEGPLAVDFLSDNEMKGISDLAASPIEGVWTLTHISGAIYKGTGSPVGDLQPDMNTGQMTLEIAGGGKLVKI